MFIYEFKRRYVQKNNIVNPILNLVCPSRGFFNRGFRGTLWFSEMSLGVPREIVIKKKSFFTLLAKIYRSTEKYHSLLKRASTIIIGLLYLQLTDHANVRWAVDIIIFMQGFPETWKLFQGFLQGKMIEKGCSGPLLGWQDYLTINHYRILAFLAPFDHGKSWKIWTIVGL
jgi:hypothetical protein